jgi:predicted dehydrogenase
MDHQNKQPMAGGDTRRDFLKKTASAAAVVATTNLFKTPVYGQNQAPSPGRVIGANDRIVVAYIGVGLQGTAHFSSQKENAQANNVVQAAVCDVSKRRVADAKTAIGGACQGYDDYRKLLEQKDIDAVTVATIDHWHTKCTIDTLEAGKHVYVEKPMTRYLGEAFQIYETVKRTGKTLQVGSQGCTDAKWKKAADLIKAGKIGQLVLGQDSYMRNNPKGEWNNPILDWCTAADVDWNQWLGTVHKRSDFNADHYFRWRKYYPYCAGILSDLLPHRLHPLMLSTGNPEFPVRVLCNGTKAVHSDRNTPGTPERDCPEDIQVLAEFPSGLSLLVTGSTVNEHGLESVIRGHKATLYFGGNRVDLKPERPFADEIDPEAYDNLTPVENIADHEKNWFECIRTGKQPNANIELAVRVQTVISLAEMSERLKAACLFDEKTRKITTDGGREITPITYGTLELS